MKNPLLLILALLMLISCDPEENEPILSPVADTIDCAEQPEVCELATLNNEFGLNLFRELHQEAPDENLFISPFSVSTALTMTLNGAEGQTYTDMHQTLAYSNLGLEEINNAYQELIGILPVLDPGVTMLPANSIWYHLTFPVNADFLNANEEYFNSEVRPVDFGDPATRDVINNWVSDHTNGKIDQLLEVIPPDAVMYLINAIYFKGDWRWPFDPANTATADFERADGSLVPVELMHYGGEIIAPVLLNETVMGVDLPYADSSFTMTLLLPRGENTVDEVIDALAGGVWEQWSAQLAPAEVEVAVPKFNLKYSKKLNDILKSMGMSIAFDDRMADFTKMGTDGLYISLVKHEAFIEVNEKGSEAGAATLVEISRESAALTSLRFTRPFVFLIREVGSNAVLFAGKVMDPS